MQGQTSHLRIIFLRQFTKELLFNFIKEDQTREKIEIEKIRQQFIEPKSEGINANEAFKKIINAPIDEKYQISIASEKKEDKRIPVKNFVIPEKPINRLTKPFSPRLINPQLNSPIKKSIEQNVAPQKQKISNIMPELQQKPLGFNLGKIEPLIQDSSIQMIECPGPGKYVMVKKYNQTNLTRTMLNDDEITSIISSFSREARIPIVGGILKAAVGNLIISAVISEFVGSRFIINKITPYSIIVK